MDKAVGESGNHCFQSILDYDVNGLGESLLQCLEAWRNILPNTVLDSILQELEKYTSFPGATFSGSGGGYIIVASQENIPGSLKIKVRC